MNNLLKEGYSRNLVFRVGNPLYEVLEHYKGEIGKSAIHDIIQISPEADYVLLTLHRSENVDDPVRLQGIINAINYISQAIKVIFSVHPRTLNKMYLWNQLRLDPSVKLIEPIGLFDFVCLEKSAKFLITDSGSVPEEGTMFSVPTIILRNSCERQELLDCGSVILAGTSCESIINAFTILFRKKDCEDILQTPWVIPDDYRKFNVSDTVINILSGQ